MDTKNKKQLRRQEKYNKNVSKQKIEQETSGKLIEENHNGQDYSREFTSRSVSWHLENLWMKTNKYRRNHDKFILFFSKLREKLQTLLLHWSPERQKDWSYWFLKDLLDIYRENKQDSKTLLWNMCYNQFRNLGLKMKD